MRNISKKYGITDEELKNGIEFVSKNLGKITDITVALAVTELLVYGDIKEEEDEKKVTNRKYMVALLQNESFVDDGGASYEALVYYHINCPYFDGDKRCLCRNNEINRENCYACKEKWLNSEVDE